MQILEGSTLIAMGVAATLAFLVQRLGLSSIIGLLFSGFLLNGMHIPAPPFLDAVAELGVYLLLFTIGLKLNIRGLLRPEISLGTLLHTAGSSTAVWIFLWLLQKFQLPALVGFSGLKLAYLSFALSFSSTVVAVKSLQERGDLSSNCGILALGILVVQDLLAVLFLGASHLHALSPWAYCLFGLILLRPILFKILDRIGHDELLVLFGLCIAVLVGAGLFKAVHIDPEFGALLMGMLLAGHTRASELSKALFTVKELFLMAFFMRIGFSGTLTWQTCSSALLLLLILPIKGLLYYAITYKFGFRIRTSLKLALILCNFSEFSLIVGDLLVKQGALTNDWLSILAVSTAFSFVLSGPLLQQADGWYERLLKHVKKPSNSSLHPDDRFIDPGKAKILILGMGRVGTGAYQAFSERYGEVILGIEKQNESARMHRDQGRNVIAFDATDPDFWQRILPGNDVQLIILAMPHWQNNQIALEQICASAYRGKIAAIAQYEDECTRLREQGVNAAFNLYREAGVGFAQHVIDALSADQFLRDQA